MTNEQLQEQVLAHINGLGITLDAFRKMPRTQSPFPINNRAVTAIARGNFEGREVGKYGLLKIKDYFNHLKNDMKKELTKHQEDVRRLFLDELESAKIQLKKVQGGIDEEYEHHRADEILCELLESLGLNDVVEEWDKVYKWYA